MMKCRACAWRMCLTCHNLETNADDDHDTEMPGHDDTATHSAPPANDVPLPTLDHLKKLAEKNMPNTITCIPHRLRKRFARVYSSKMNELQSPTWREADTQEREMLNLLAWIAALILGEDEMGTELHKEPHSRAAGSELDEWDGLIERGSSETAGGRGKEKMRTPTNSKTRSRLTSEG